MKTARAARFWSPDSIQRIVPHGSCIARSDDQSTSSSAAAASVVIDSRLATPGSVFAALKGEHADGHDFVHDAVNRGATTILVERRPTLPPSSQYPANVSVINVSNVVVALADLARAYRRQLTGPAFLAVTGSTGKTTTKNLLAAVLQTSGPVTASQKSFNNHLGVPLTILNAKPDDRFVICEIGTNAPGEIAHLASIVAPDIAMITNVGTSHVQGLGSLERIAREKASLLDHLADHGIGFLCADQDALGDAAKDKPCSQFTFGTHERADLRMISATAGENGTHFKLNDLTIWGLPLIGTHHAVNAVGVIAVARHAGVSDTQIARAIQSVRPAAGRFVPLPLGDAILFDDSYNANPDSMSAAIGTFFEITSDRQRRTLILGDMLELGPSEQTEHQNLGRRLARLCAASQIPVRIVLLGPAMKSAANELSARPSPGIQWIHRTDVDDQAIESAVLAAESADRILVKGSRLNRLERVAKALKTP